MNYVRRQDKLGAFFATLVVCTLIVAVIPARAQTYKILDNFLTGGPGPEWPGGPLAQGRDGRLYGWSYLGGANNTGSIWKTTPSGKVSVVLSFAAGTGNDCQTGMTLGTDGNFYGSADTNCGGDGYVFKMTPSGTITVLHTFTGTPDGSGPGLLVQYTDGDFYGITTNGGANNYGTVFKITPAGTVTILYSFDNTNYFANPTYGLTVGNDGDFYGTFSGADGLGGVFKMTPAGVVTLLHKLAGDPTEGATPGAGVTLGKDGNFYGPTRFGGTSNVGTIFKMTPSGKLSTLRNFTTSDYANFPEVPLLQATDGNFYSAANSCNQFNGCLNQDIYKITPSGTFTVVEEFTGSNGQWPFWPLTQDTNGTLYGLAQQGGPVNGGVLFSLNIGAKPFINLVSTSGKVGSKVGILGQGFSSSSVVKFNGVTATTVTRTGTTFLLATVPSGASDGTVTVTTGSTALTSPQTFIVHDSWRSGAVLPTARMGAAAGAIGSDIYVIGGYTLNGAIGNNDIYNPEKNTWTSGAADPNPRAFAAYAVVNKKLYMFGGSNGSALLSVAEAYDPASNTWSTLAPVPYVSETASAVADKDVIYVIGGQDLSGYLTTVESYNTTTNTWTAEAPLLTAKAWSAVGLLGNTVVSADGSNSGTYLSDNEGYNATNNIWTGLTPDPTPRNPGCNGAIDGRLYVAGGNTPTVITLNEAYNPGKNAWATLTPIPHAPGIGAGSAVDNGNLYCFGGGIFLTNVYDYVQIYQP
jgi:uncharacterized repeat protein (TIGR03803 family)